MGAVREVDARGLLCPWPALRLAREMRDHAEVAITVDDPAAPSELRELAGLRGWQLERLGSDPARFLVRQG